MSRSLVAACPARDCVFIEVAMTAAGLSLNLNEAATTKYCYRQGYLAVVRRADGSVHDW